MLLANRIAVGRCFVMVALNMAGIAAAAAGPLLALVLPASAQSAPPTLLLSLRTHTRIVHFSIV